MSLWLIIPVKPFGEGKSRLAPRLDTAGRAALSRDLLRGVLDASRASGLFAGTLVVSRDPNALAVAQDYGALPVAEAGNGLNEALEEARRRLPPETTALVVLPTDLPSIAASDLRTLAALDDGEPGIVIVPSSTGGTNALLLRPPHALPFAYGTDSFARHCRLARERGLAVRVWNSAALSFDVDVPDDLSNPALSSFAW